jgi:uncharacterized protein YfaP (DUF2135 family)
MAKVILEFDSVEEQAEINSAINGWKWEAAMWDLDQELRKTIKYDVSNINHNQTACSVEYAMAERYRELIREMLSNHGLNFNM